MKILRWLNPEDWKRAVALVILWAYAYQLVAWPALIWLTNALTIWTGVTVPPPAIVPWEALGLGTTTLATVGGIQTWRERIVDKLDKKEHAEASQ